MTTSFQRRPKCTLYCATQGKKSQSSSVRKNSVSDELNVKIKKNDVSMDSFHVTKAYNNHARSKECARERSLD